jgi:RNA polymerase sigma-70 factor, ECF subfamily
MIATLKKNARGLRAASKVLAPLAARGGSAPINSFHTDSARMPALSASCDPLLDDAALIDQITQGNAEAANALVERLRPTILKCIRRRLPRWMDEEDLMQNVFAKIFSHLHQFSGSVPLEHWVSRIAINTSLNQIDHEAVRPELRMSDLSEEHEIVLENRPQTGETADELNYAREAIELLMAQLKPDERLIITLLHLEQRSTQEISQLTGMSISLVKVKAFRTRHKMKRFSKKLLRGEIAALS